MSFKPLKIGKHTIKYPIFQGGMGLGISWDRLASAVSLNGGLGIISSVGTGYYEERVHISKELNAKPYGSENFYSKEGLKALITNARKVCGDAPLGCNILCASNDYARIAHDACEVGFNVIVSGAGLPTNLPEFTADFPDVALVPIISSAKALKIICKRWQGRYNRLPDAVVLEGPKSGGHQGFTYEQCFDPNFALENLIAPVVEEAKNWGSFPIIAAGGVWDKNDIEKMLKLGASGVQMGTRFIGTFECDASDNFKEVLLASKEEDIKLIKSPVGYPARGVQTNLLDLVAKKMGPKINCISNCVSPCGRGKEATKVGYCIADRLFDAWSGKKDTGLFFTGANGYRLDKLISVKELIDKLVNGE
ncbi:nitronate monooxygenase [Campylobacter upsaliensis]|uniref:nitronate monooxygenase n=1 Tax=Campylobacter upsaliensis TaxID=28080 RepID=UPI00004B2CD6|nr:nitronate monooxygenase family protein [Campylobacter upsaliensis]EAL53060.1 oxidoreductase, 2-nitropropane dioxygenase family subfamily [Campylobacter upsaliensis RM3195]MCR2101126.1 nitronate monooxygenase family protein [Campylobacter upsaliensis]MCR2108483.1 nitronate monooxygenase family protein [Campylobacter upsaliensis]MCR2110358.1 nitronate monooxygenase family protein [Campylobacter upsaliensis]MCR2112040.1 nitronate monooxygenase family protein [Campylobacter upsaliensis]